MTSIQHQSIRPLAEDECATVSGGCFPIFSSDGHGGVIMTSPTLDRGPKIPLGGGTLPTFPTDPSGGFPV